MPHCDKGLYCAQCDKHIVDFTHMSVREIKATRSEEEVCGVFLPEQVHPHLIKPIKLGERSRLFAFVSTLFMTTAVDASPEVPHQMEWSSVEDEGSQIELRESFAQHYDKGKRQEKRAYRKAKRYAKRRHRYYWSWRFPFIHKVPTRTGGVVRWL